MDKLKVYRIISGIGMILLSLIGLFTLIALLGLGASFFGPSYSGLQISLLSIFLFMIAIFIFLNKKWAKIIAIVAYSIVILFLLFYTVAFFFINSEYKNYSGLIFFVSLLFLDAIPLILTIIELKNSKNVSNNRKMKGGKIK